MMTFINLILFFMFIALLYQFKNWHYQLSTRILLGLLFGVFYGVTLKFMTNSQLLMFIQDCLHILGYGYLALLKMLVVPLILFSIIHAIINLGDGNGQSIKQLSLWSCGMLLGMTALASLIGIAMGVVFSVGEGMRLPDINEQPTHVYKGWVDTVLSMIPSNPVGVMVQENTIGVLIFAVLVAISAHLLGHKEQEKMQVFRKMIATLFVIIKKLASIIMGLTPYGVFALLALLLLDQGLLLLKGMATFIMAMYAAILLVMVMHTIILLLIGKRPSHYFKLAYLPLFVAFTTRSSFGTLPVTEETLRDRFKVHQVIATFVPSIGSTIGMNACAGIFPAMLVVMVLTILHQPLTLPLIISVMLLNAVASLGISGIPGTAYIAATVTLTSLHLPYSIIALVQGIDPIIDMGRTAANVNGVMTTALVVDKVLPQK